MRQVLRREQWPALARARDLLSPVVDWLFRGDRFRAWDRLASVGFLGLAPVLAHRPGRRDARSLHPFQDAAFDRLGNSSQGEYLGAQWIAWPHFLWVLGVIADHGLLKGKTVGVDATTLEG